MSISHHPSDLLLAEYASGALAAAPGLVVSAHIGRCSPCRDAVSALEEAGGAMLNRIAPAPLKADALERALERLDQAEAPPRSTAPFRSATTTFPRGVTAVEIGSPASPGWTVIELRAPAGAILPAPRRRGLKYACLLEGTVSDGVQRYRAGDFATADGENVRRTVAVIGGPCVALLAGYGVSRR